MAFPKFKRKSIRNNNAPFAPSQDCWKRPLRCQQRWRRRRRSGEDKRYTEPRQWFKRCSVLLGCLAAVPRPLPPRLTLDHLLSYLRDAVQRHEISSSTRSFRANAFFRVLSCILHIRSRSRNMAGRDKWILWKELWWVEERKYEFPYPCLFNEFKLNF